MGFARARIRNVNARPVGRRRRGAAPGTAANMPDFKMINRHKLLTLLAASHEPKGGSR